MKQLILKDGTEYSVLDDSNIMQIRMEVETFAAVDNITAKFTRANMETVTLGAEEFHEVVPVSVSVVMEDGQKIAIFYNQDGMEDYIQNRIANYTEWLIDEGVI